jgi:hypothetical protein
MNYDTLYLEFYQDLVESGMDTDQARVEAQDLADQAFDEYRADLLHEQMKGH